MIFYKIYQNSKRVGKLPKRTLYILHLLIRSEMVSSSFLTDGDKWQAFQMQREWHFLISPPTLNRNLYFLILPEKPDCRLLPGFVEQWETLVCFSDCLMCLFLQYLLLFFEKLCCLLGLMGL